MTNLDIIKYIAFNKPARLAELLDDIYCISWNNGAYTERTSKNDNDLEINNDWLNQPAANSELFHNYELKEYTNESKIDADIADYLIKNGVTLADHPTEKGGVQE